MCTIAVDIRTVPGQTPESVQQDIEKILDEIKAERVRQDAKWGEQNHPSISLGIDGPQAQADFYRIPREAKAKEMCEANARAGTVSYTHIALEEFCEAVEAPDDKARREELVQLAAVVVAWIEAIDRRER